MRKTIKASERNLRIKSFLEEEWNLRQSQSTGAGGEHEVSISFTKSPKKIQANGWSQKVWSKNGKWSGNNSFVEIVATYRTLKHFPMLTTPDGIHLVDALKLAPRIYEIKWLKNSRGFDVKIVSGWLIKGYHVKGKSYELAKKWVQMIRDGEAREHRINRFHVKSILSEYRNIWVSFEDSLAGGNCRQGTIQFVRNKLLPYMRKRFGKIGDIGAIRGDLLLNFAGDNPYVRKALRAAERRYSRDVRT